MRKMIKTIIIILLISNFSWAQESVYLNKGDAASFNGYLLPESEVVQLRNNTLDMEMYKTESTLKDTQINLLTTQNNSLAKTVEDEKNLTLLEKVGFFAAGVIITGLAIDGASKIINH